MLQRRLRVAVGQIGRVRWLSGGLNLGRFKETVDEYADAHQMYNEFIHDSWPRIAALTDEERHSRVIQHQFGRP